MPIDEITVDDLASLPTGSFVLDVRNPDEHAEARVPGVVLIPLPELESRVGELPKGRPIAVLCRGGYRSMIALSLLERRELGPLTDLEGGFTAWQSAGLPTVS